MEGGKLDDHGHDSVITLRIFLELFGTSSKQNAVCVVGSSGVVAPTALNKKTDEKIRKKEVNKQLQIRLYEKKSILSYSGYLNLNNVRTSCCS